MSSFLLDRDDLLLICFLGPHFLRRLQSKTAFVKMTIVISGGRRIAKPALQGLFKLNVWGFLAIWLSLFPNIYRRGNVIVFELPLLSSLNIRWCCCCLILFRRVIRRKAGLSSSRSQLEDSFVFLIVISSDYTFDLGGRHALTFVNTRTHSESWKIVLSCIAIVTHFKSRIPAHYRVLTQWVLLRKLTHGELGVKVCWNGQSR